MDQQISEQIVKLYNLMESKASGSNNFIVAIAEAVIMDVINYIKSFPMSIRQVGEERIEVFDLPVGASHVVTSARSLTSMLEAGEFKDSADAELRRLYRHVYLNIAYPAV
jgi:hypothetical protein